MQKIVTHSGNFHPDDVFAVATIMLVEGKENIEVIRSRDPEIIAIGDWVVDVGNEYDSEQKRFDHHQNDAPIRENGIPYAAFGLVWKHYGEQVAGNRVVADVVETRLCQAIDAPDNGISLFTVNTHQVEPVLLFHVLDSFKPVWGSDEDIDQAFLSAVGLAVTFLERFILKAHGELKMADLIQRTYDQAEEKSVLIFDEKINAAALIPYQDVTAVVYPSKYGDTVAWSTETVRKEFNTFEPRVSFPLSWSGLRGDELENTTGVPGVTFCHKARFLCKSDTKEAAIKIVDFLQ